MSELTQSQQLSPILLSQATEAVDNSQPHLASQLHHKSFPLFSDNYANDDNQSVEENARPHTDKDDDKSYDPDRVAVMKMLAITMIMCPQETNLMSPRARSIHLMNVSKRLSLITPLLKGSGTTQETAQLLR